MTKVYFLFILAFFIGIINCQDRPTEPTICTPTNHGHCECGDQSLGFHTYIFYIGEQQRCFTIFHPPARASDSLPVFFHNNCYAKDQLQGLEMVNANSAGNHAASRFGYARIGLSSPTGSWHGMGNDGIVNDDIPMPCDDEDNVDIPYLKKVFEFIESHPNHFDASKIWAEGFSQNSVFSAYLGFCFSDKVLGISQGGSGLAITGQKPYFPGCEGQVAHSDIEACHGNCEACIQTHPCEECKYWPIYPCYSEKKPMISCIHEYTNDPVSVDPANPDEHSSSLYMYEKMMAEGHDPRMFRFSPGPDGHPGGHSPPQNYEYWRVGCLGVTPSCSKQCEASFLECMNAEFEDGAIAFRKCIADFRFPNLAGCTLDCAPTFNMLKTSEEPAEARFDNFGPGLGTPSPRPDSSLCIANSN